LPDASQSLGRARESPRALPKNEERLLRVARLLRAGQHGRDGRASGVLETGRRHQAGDQQTDSVALCHCRVAGMKCGGVACHPNGRKTKRKQESTGPDVGRAPNGSGPPGRRQRGRRRWPARRASTWVGAALRGCHRLCNVTVSLCNLPCVFFFDFPASSRGNRASSA